MRMIPLLIFSFLLFLPGQSGAVEKSVYELKLEELGKVRFSTAAALTVTEENKIPASVTTITRKMIEASGARSLDELLEYFVPNLAVIEHHGSGQHFGLRGINSDLDNKVILLVNGRVMNHKAVYGAITERFMSMLGDIDHINVIRGPGSALYGSGAIAGVIDIHVLDSSGFDGASVQVRQGVVEDFSALEFKLGHKLGADRGLFLYYGIDDYRGAAGDDSPGFISNDFERFDVQAGHVEDLTRQHGSEDVRHKLHLDYTDGNFKAFARYTRGGVYHPGTYFFTHDNYLYYRQLTAHLEYDRSLSDHLQLKLSGGFDSTLAGRTTNSEDVFYLPEEELNLRALLQWTPAADHRFALGTEYSREFFAKDHLDIGPDVTPMVVSGVERTPWNTNSYSVFGEYQWTIDDHWTLFAGGRGDKHSYTDWLLSPKLACVWTPSPRHSLKLIYNESVRKTDDEPLEALVRSNTISSAEVEEIQAVELRHDYTYSDNLSLAYSAFYYSWDALGYSSNIGREGEIGTVEAAGLELELAYQGLKHDVVFSHSYTQLLNLHLDDPTLTDQNISSEPYGYGRDFQNWSPHISKLRWLWRLAEQLNLNSSVQVFWGFPGASDYADYNRDNLGINGRTISDGRQDAFRASVYLNTGLNYTATQQLKLGLHLYNILGWLDKDLNKRNRFIQMGQFRDEAAAAAVTLTYRF